jgi:alpha-galactosidase/6-phospho-beta-glucosidase family protein
MKITFIGAGSHRFAATARSLLASPDLTIDEIALYDINRVREETMALFIEKVPEYQENPCLVSRNQSLEKALEGADLVNIVILANDPSILNSINRACSRYGFMSNSWPMTPCGALRAPKVCSIVLDIARKMEKLCPDAWLLDFSNPVSVASGVINHHTKIQGYGICDGFSNHLWDISRLFGKDEMAVAADNDIHCSGVNHFSFISPESTWKGRNLYQQLDELVATGHWSPPAFSSQCSKEIQKNITNGLNQLLLGYQRFGYLLFSSEADGVAAMNVSGFAEPLAKKTAEQSDNDSKINLKKMQDQRQEADRQLADFIKTPSKEINWDDPIPENPYLRKKENGLITLMAMAKSKKPVRVVTSVPNNGAIKDLPDNFIVEFSQVFENGQMRPSLQHKLPTVWHSWIAAFAAHQTLLADAIATDCPKTFFEALSCYPVKRDSSEFWAMWREVLPLASDEISPNLNRVIEFLP